MQIIFKEIKIKNFLSIGEASFAFSQKGITVIEGKNLQDSCSNSNGSGKSSLFEAILWNLTGSTSRGTNEVSNKVTGFPAEVSLSFTFDKINYEVIRKSNPSSLKILREGADISGSTFLKSKKVLSEILGYIDYELLSSIIILSQGLGSRLSILKPSERKARIEFFSNLQGLISLATEEASAVYSKVDKEATAITNEIGRLTNQVSYNNGLISEYRKKIEEQQANSSYILSSEKIAQIQGLLACLEEREAVLNSEIQEAAKANYQIELDRSRLSSEYKLNQSQFDQLKSDYIKILQNICPTCNQPIQDSQEKSASYEQMIKEKKAELNKIKEQILAIPALRDTSEKQAEKEEIKKQIQELSLKLSLHNRYSAETSVFENFIKEREEENEKLKEQAFPLERQLMLKKKNLEIAQWIKNAVSKKFRNFLLDGVVDYLNKRIGIYSEYLFKSKKVHIENRENNLYICLDDYAFENLSGGEGRRVDLILQLALRDLAINQTGFYCNILVLDEVFDYLDKTGIGNFLFLIDNEFALADSVIIVTHRDKLDIPLTSKYTVIKNEQGISSITRYE